jgi:NAD(P)H-dependent FMN reductase
MQNNGAAMNILVISGTNRKGALSRRLSDQVAKKHKALGADVDVLDLAEDMTADFVDPGAYKEKPAAVQAAVDRFLAADGVVFVVAEYNGSYPGALKLYIDMLPYPDALDGRPCCFLGLAAGQFNGLRAVEHLQQVTGYRNAYNYPRRLFIGNSYQQFGADGLTDDSLVERVQEQAAGFQSFIAAVSSS